VLGDVVGSVIGLALGMGCVNLLLLALVVGALIRAVVLLARS
jgi:hypothetical protein